MPCSFPTYMQLTQSSIEYNKKPGKPAQVKVVKDATVPRDDLYKSSTIHTGPGEPPNSISKPTPKGKQIAAKPITKGKLLRPGGPGGGPSKLASRPAQPRPVPHACSRTTEANACCYACSNAAIRTSTSASLSTVEWHGTRWQRISRSDTSSATAAGPACSSSCTERAYL
jgi:hypothetical protein